MSAKSNPAGSAARPVLGIPEIDQQHDSIFHLFDRIGALTADAYRPLDDDEVDRLLDILSELRDLALEHFTTEEAYMTEADYPDLEGHATAHVHFMDDITRLEVELMNGSAIPTVTIRTALMDWYAGHIVEMDQPFGEFYKKSRE